jgi:hypothetical protein
MDHDNTHLHDRPYPKSNTRTICTKQPIKDEWGSATSKACTRPCDPVCEAFTANEPGQINFLPVQAENEDNSPLVKKDKAWKVRDYATNSIQHALRGDQSFHSCAV